jgi:hypothetical protein
MHYKRKKVILETERVKEKKTSAEILIPNYLESASNNSNNLVIAQLVERWTVEGLDSSVQVSIGHWFDSGSRDITFDHFLIRRTFRRALIFYLT